LNKLIHAWQTFFFQPGSPRALGICRVCVYAMLLWVELKQEPGSWTQLDPSFWMPMPLFQTLGWQMPGEAIWTGVTWVWRGSLLLSSIGLCTGLATKVAFVLGVFVLGLPNNLGMVQHKDSMPVFVLAIFALARSGDYLSLDNWIRNRVRQAPREGRQDSPEYTWPIRLAWVLMVLVFFAAGVSKLRNSGWRWIDSDNMRNNLIQHHYTHEPPFRFGLVVAQSPGICRMIGGTTMMVELLAPLALACSRARLPIIGGLFLMQAGIWALLGVDFPIYLACYLFWIPWNWLDKVKGDRDES